MTDDMIIVGSTEQVHDLRLTKVIQRIAERELTVDDD